MTYDKDILLNQDNDLDFLNGDVVIGESLLQEVSIIARLQSGELKSDPILGPNLIQLIKSNSKQADIEQRLRIHLARDGKEYNELKQYIQVNGTI